MLKLCQDTSSLKHNLPLAHYFVAEDSLVHKKIDEAADHLWEAYKAKNCDSDVLDECKNLLITRKFVFFEINTDLHFSV